MVAPAEMLAYFEYSVVKGAIENVFAFSRIVWIQVR